MRRILGKTRSISLIALLVALLALTMLWFQLSGQQLVTRELLSYLQSENLPGVVLAYGRPGASPVVLAAGRNAAGDDALPLHAEMRFRLASLSKPITAAAVLELVRQGHLNLDERLTQILPWARAAKDARFARITVRHLLGHEAGWDRKISGDPFDRKTASMGQPSDLATSDLSACAVLARDSLAMPLDFDPGQRQAYSNLGYCWLGLVLRQITGRSYAKAVHDLVPQSGDLTLDAKLIDAGTTPSSAAGSVALDPLAATPAGGWIGHAAAYFAFATRDLSDVATLMADTRTQAESYSLGWRVASFPEGKVLSHYGVLPGSFSIVLRRPDNWTFVALFSASPSDPEASFVRFRQLVRELPLDPGL